MHSTWCVFHDHVGITVQSGLEEAVLRNIEAAKKLCQLSRTSLGPNGMNKMVINHLDKLFVTNDAATIVNELEVVHPAAKMLVMASQQQEKEVYYLLVRYIGAFDNRLTEIYPWHACLLFSHPDG